MSETAVPYTTTPVAEALYEEGLDTYLQKAHDDDAAFDLRAVGDWYISPNERAIVPTGIRVAIPKGYAGLVLPRSGLAAKYGVTVVNAPGLIDPGYRGEVKVILKNGGDIPFEFGPGERIAQLIVIQTAADIARYFTPERFDEMFGGTERGDGGFGSTGR